MSYPMIVRGPAESDLIETFDHLEKKQMGLGQRFLQDVGRKLSQIELMPEMFGVVWLSVRAVRLSQFPYVIYYLVTPDGIEVMAVIHGSRDESAWKSRLESPI